MLSDQHDDLDKDAKNECKLTEMCSFDRLTRKNVSKNFLPGMYPTLTLI